MRTENKYNLFLNDKKTKKKAKKKNPLEGTEFLRTN